MDTVFFTSFERAVVELERAVCRDRSHVVLATSPGPGRGALTRVLEQRLSGSLRPLEIPVPTATREEIRARIVHQLGGDPSAVSEEKMKGLLREIAAGGSALLLLIRDADAMPVETLSWLGRVAAQSAKGLRIVLVVTVRGGSPGDLIPGLIAALGVGAQKVMLEAPGERIAGASTASPDATSAGWAKPWRSRIDTIRALTIRPHDFRQSRWPGRIAFVAAVVLVALGTHHLQIVPTARVPGSSPATSSTSTLAAEPTAERATTRFGPGSALAPHTRSHPPVRSQPGVRGQGPLLAAATGEPADPYEPLQPVLAVRADPPVAVAGPLVPTPGAAAEPVAGSAVDVAVGGGHASKPDVGIDVLREPVGGERAPVVAERSGEVAPESAEPAPEPARELVPVPAPSVAAVEAPIASDAPVTLAEPSRPGNEIGEIGESGTQPEAEPDAAPPPAGMSGAPERRESAPTVVSVSIDARPGARIRVDGREVGTTPLTELKLAPGPHRFHALLSDGRVFERTLHVDEFRDRISFP